MSTLQRFFSPVSYLSLPNCRFWQKPHVRAMVGDIIVVALWAASIPSLMWLGAAIGF